MHQTEQVMQAHFHTSFPFPPRHRVLGDHSHAKFFNAIFVRVTAAACLCMPGNAPSCQFTLQVVRLLNTESSFPIPASLEKESCNLPALPCISGVVLALFALNSEVSNPLSSSSIYLSGGEKNTQTDRKHEVQG